MRRFWVLWYSKCWISTIVSCGIMRGMIRYGGSDVSLCGPVVMITASWVGMFS